MEAGAGGNGSSRLEFKDQLLKKQQSKSFECPVCMEVMVPQIYQCYNGHTFCHNCEPRLTSCPVCRELLPQRKIRTLALEAIIIDMSFDCKNKDLGCPVTLTPLEFAEHEFQCKYAKHPFCKLFKINSCNYECNVRDVIDHMKDVHHLTGIDMMDLEKKGQDWVKIQQELPRSDFANVQNLVEYSPHYFLFHGQRFVLLSKLDLKARVMMWKMTVLGGKSMASRFNVKMKVMMNSDSHVEILKWHGGVADLKGADIPHQRFIFKLRLSTLEKFLQGYPNFLRWSVYVQLLVNTPPKIQNSVSVSGSGVPTLETTAFRYPQPQLALNPSPTDFHISGSFQPSVFGAGHGFRFGLSRSRPYCPRPEELGLVGQHIMPGVPTVVLPGQSRH